VHSLRKPFSELEEQIKNAIIEFDNTQTVTYASSNNDLSPGKSNPAILLDAFVREDNEKMKDLIEKYSFKFVLWKFSSENIRLQIISKYWTKPDEIFIQLYNAISGAKYIEIIGVSDGKIFEELIPGFIKLNGLCCEPFDSKHKNLFIGKGLDIVECIGETDVKNIIKKYTENKLYFFGKKQEAFDMFVPPNNFIQIANTLKEDKGNHTITVKPMLICCEEIGPINFIIAVKEDDKNNWNKNPKSFKVNDEKMVEAIQQHEKEEKLPKKNEKLSK
jgi:hypothetical protein